MITSHLFYFESEIDRAVIATESIWLGFWLGDLFHLNQWHILIFWSVVIIFMIRPLLVHWKRLQNDNYIIRKKQNKKTLCRPKAAGGKIILLRCLILRKFWKRGMDWLWQILRWEARDSPGSNGLRDYIRRQKQKTACTKDAGCWNYWWFSFDSSSLDSGGVDCSSGIPKRNLRCLK